VAVLDLASQLARALAAAHAQGVIHRDLKPENIVRTASGAIKVPDFGIARIENIAGAHLTASDTAIGTPQYMSPEQIRHEDVDFRADLFSFGVLVYEMAAGANPFDAGTATASIVRILETDPPPLPSHEAAGLDRISADVCENGARIAARPPGVARPRATASTLLTPVIPAVAGARHEPVRAGRLTSPRVV
jgi:serine/threonine protein kinase